MIVIFGGAYQGKIAYVKRKYYVAQEEIADCQNENLCFDKAVITHLERFVFAYRQKTGDPFQYIAENLPKLRNKIIICDDISSGVVPYTKENRQWREDNGKILQMLCQVAEEKYRIFCGIAQPLENAEENTASAHKMLYLIRHGKTEAILQHLYCGATDLPLHETGIQEINQKKEAGIYPLSQEIDAFYTSGMKRTKETLQTIYGDVLSHSFPSLREFDFGEYEMLSYDELVTRKDYQAFIADRSDTCFCTGGENKMEFTERIRFGIQRLVRTIMTDSTQKSALLICHGGVIAQIMDTYFPMEKNFYEWQPSAGDGYLVEIGVKNGKYGILSYQTLERK